MTPGAYALVISDHLCELAQCVALLPSEPDQTGISATPRLSDASGPPEQQIAPDLLLNLLGHSTLAYSPMIVHVSGE